MAATASGALFTIRKRCASPLRGSMGKPNKALERSGANRERHDERTCAGRSAPSRWADDYRKLMATWAFHSRQAAERRHQRGLAVTLSIAMLATVLAVLLFAVPLAVEGQEAAKA